jgi:hypothetical protein
MPKRRERGHGVTLTPKRLKKTNGKEACAPGSVLRALHADTNRILEIEWLIERAAKNEGLKLGKSGQGANNLWAEILSAVVEGIYCYHIRKSKSESCHVPMSAATLTETAFTEQTQNIRLGDRDHSQKFSQMVIAPLLKIYHGLEKPALLLSATKEKGPQYIHPERVRHVVHEICFIKLKIAGWLATWLNILKLSAEHNQQVLSLIANVPTWFDELADAQDEIIAEHYSCFHRAFYQIRSWPQLFSSKRSDVRDVKYTARALRKMAREVLPVDVMYLPCEMMHGVESNEGEESDIQRISSNFKKDEDSESVTTEDSLPSSESLFSGVSSEADSVLDEINDTVSNCDEEDRRSTDTVQETESEDSSEADISGSSVNIENSIVKRCHLNHQVLTKDNLEDQIERMAEALCVVGVSRSMQHEEIVNSMEGLLERIAFLSEVPPSIAITEIKLHELSKLEYWRIFPEKGIFLTRGSFLPEKILALGRTWFTVSESKNMLAQISGHEAERACTP